MNWTIIVVLLLAVTVAYLVGSGDALAIGGSLRNQGFSMDEEIETVFDEKDRCNTDILFILDASSSVEEDFRAMKRYMAEVTKILTVAPNGHQVAILEFSAARRKNKWPRYQFGEIQSNKQFLDVVNTLPYLRGTTHAGAAVEIALQMLKRRRPGHSAIVFFVTDGWYHDFDMMEKFAPILQKVPNTTVFCAAVPEKYSFIQMLDITGNRKRILTPPNLVEKTHRILWPIIGCKLSTTTTTTTTTTSPLPDPTDPPTTTVDPVTGCEVDLLFIFDYSQSVDEIHSQYVTIALDIIKLMKVGADYTRVALVKFSTEMSAESVFHFKRGVDSKYVAQMIRTTAFLGGTTWTGNAISHSMGEFQARYGARKGLAKWVCVLFSDGLSQQDPTEQALKLRNMGVELYTVGVHFEEFEPDKQQLADITGDMKLVYTNGNLRKLKDKLAGYNQNCKR